MITVSSSVLKSALKVMTKVSPTNVRNFRNISLIIRTDPQAGKTEGWLGSTGWGFSASVIYSLGVVSDSPQEDYAASFPVEVWKGILSLAPKGKKEVTVQITTATGEGGPTMTVKASEGPEITFTGLDVVNEGVIPSNYADPDPTSQITIPAEVLRHGFANTLTAVALQDMGRPSLERIMVTWKGEELRMYSSDGRRLSRVVLPDIAVSPDLQERSSGEKQYLSAIHHPVAALFQSLNNLPDTVVLTPRHPFNNQFSRDAGTTLVMQTLACGPLMIAWSFDSYFPDLERAVPNDSNITGGFRTSRTALLSILDMMTGLWNQFRPKKTENVDALVKFSKSGEELEVSLCGSDLSPVKLPAVFFVRSGDDDDRYPVGFNAEYMKKWIRIQDSEELVISMISSTKASIITGGQDVHNQYVIMPVIIR